VQNDRDDVIRELARMPGISKRLYVILSASRAKSSVFKLPFKCPDGGVSSMYLYNKPSQYTSDPIDERAWTMQKAILSPRVLALSENWLFWTNQTAATKDNTPKTIPEPYEGTRVPLQDKVSIQGVVHRRILAQLI